MSEKVAIMFGVTALCMLSPGPDMVLVMRNTLTRDRASGGLTALGVLTGNLVHIGYSVFGLAALLAHSPLVYDGFRLASAAYLVYLGFQSLRSRSVGVSAAFWVVFVQVLHLPLVRSRFDRYAVAVDRAFGVLLIALGVTVALSRGAA